MYDIDLAAYLWLNRDYAYRGERTPLLPRYPSCLMDDWAGTLVDKTSVQCM